MTLIILCPIYKLIHGVYDMKTLHNFVNGDIQISTIFSWQVLFETLIDYLADFKVTDDLFESVKQDMTRSYYNHNITKSSLNTYVSLCAFKWGR